MAPGKCNCAFAKNYPYAFQPRLGAAYQISPKTVLRIGFGIVYSGTADSNSAVSGGLTSVQPVNSPTFGNPVMGLRTGIPFAPLPYPNFDVGQFPQPGYAGNLKAVRLRLTTTAMPDGPQDSGSGASAFQREIVGTSSSKPLTSATAAYGGIRRD
jgi:hypothetical protein